WLPSVLRQRCWDRRLAYAAWSLAVAGSFAALFLGPIRAPRGRGGGAGWLRPFPGRARPWRVAGGAGRATSGGGRYRFMPLGHVLSVLAVVGAWAAWRTQRRKELLVLAGPLGLALLGAWLHGYPYGGSRLEVFAAPGLAVLIAGGLLQVRSRLGNALAV